jgi:hypothetical protein
VRQHSEKVAKTTPWLLASAMAIGWGMCTIAVLHIISSRNPALDTLSSYAFTDRGSGMLETSMLSLAIGSLLVLGALTAAKVTITRTTRALFCTWSGGLTMAAAFPASYEKFPNPVSGEIHQYSCLVAFLSLPAIGFSLLRRLREHPTLARWTWLSVASLALFGVSYLLAPTPVLPVGVAQRIALIADLVLLCSLLALAAKAAQRTEVASR